MLQQCGVSHLVVVHDEERLFSDEPRLTIRITVVPSLDVARGHLDEPFVVARFDRHVAPEVYRQILAADPQHPALVAVDGEDALGVIRVDPAWNASPSTWCDPNKALAAGARPLAIDAGWSADLTTQVGRAEALDHLLTGCCKPTDGFVSRHINRRVSRLISRCLVDAPISPNTVTGITFAFSLAGAACALRGDYAATVAAAALMQLASILDGVDGELARIRFQVSKLGAWLDTLADDGSNVLFWLALGWGSQAAGKHELLWLAGVAAATCNAAASLINYRRLARLGTGDLNALKSSGPRWLADLFKQDFFLLAMFLLAIADRIHEALVVIAIGAVGTLLNALAALVRQEKRR